MKHPIRIFYFLLAFAVCSFSYGQMADYNYKRELKGVTDQWHKIVLPDELFEKISQNLTDIRIFGLTESNDTVTAPYLLRLSTEKISNKDVAFKTINVSRGDKGYYFTFEISDKEPINEMKLDFGQENFDWRVTLQGSQDQNEWFTVLENYRILSIKNTRTNFQFTKLTFPSSKYRFFRLRIDSKEKPELKLASIRQQEIIDGSFRKYNIKKFNTRQNRQTNQTEIDVELQRPVRVSHVKIVVLDTFDYYRPVTITCVIDSVKRKQDWVYRIKTLTTGTVNSMTENELQFSSTTVQKLKIYIDNEDNQPLTINTIEVKGYIHELITRFTSKATYYLTYGNEKAVMIPNYDIDRFAYHVPTTITTLDLGHELSIEKEELPVATPLFENKIWLWIILIVITLSLGWFSIKMMKNNHDVQE